MTPLLSQAVHQYAAGKYSSNASHSNSLGGKIAQKAGVWEGSEAAQIQVPNQITKIEGA